MADDEKPEPAAPPVNAGAQGSSESVPPPFDDGARDRDRSLSDMFRRAVTVGLEAAGRGKDDFVRIAGNEVRQWLDHLELDTELRKALSKMVLEVKAEVRFRSTDDGQVVPETESEMRIRQTGKTERQS